MRRLAVGFALLLAIPAVVVTAAAMGAWRAVTFAWETYVEFVEEEMS